MTELKPCPFCGEGVSLDMYEFENNAGVICGAEYGISCKCGITLEGYYGQPGHEIVDAWNRRAKPVVSKMERAECELIGCANQAITKDCVDSKNVCLKCYVDLHRTLPINWKDLIK